MVDHIILLHSPSDLLTLRQSQLLRTITYLERVHKAKFLKVNRYFPHA